jgi:hypothetical protein
MSFPSLPQYPLPSSEPSPDARRSWNSLFVNLYIYIVVIVMVALFSIGIACAFTGGLILELFEGR